MFPLLIAQRALKIRKKAAATAIERLARKLEPGLRKRFLAAVQDIEDDIELEELALAVQSGSVTKADIAVKIREWPEKFGELSLSLIAGFMAGATLAYQVLDGAKFNLQFNYINPHAVTYSHERMPKIVMDYMADARTNIRDIITDAVSGKYTPQEAAREIRNHIGLTPQYAQAVTRHREELLSSGMDADKAAAKVDRYRKKLLKTRSMTIARTEIVRAQAAGQRALWEEAAKEGLFNRHTAKVRWRTNNEGTTNLGYPTPCTICAPLDGLERTFGGLYEHPEYGQQDVFGDALIGPPMHPRCLCHEELVP